MAISLNKGGRLSLDKEAPGLKKVLVGLGWDARATDGAAFDLDASAFMLNADGQGSLGSGFHLLQPVEIRLRLGAAHRR
jgi:tellurium resistance protein TerD